MTAAQIHQWPMASAANAAKQRLDAGRGSLADQQCLRAWDRKTRRHGSTMAFDSANGLQDNDDESEVGTAADPFSELLQWLAQKLEPADLSVAEGMIEDALRTSDTDTDIVGDEPLLVPRMGGALARLSQPRTTAMDSATIRAIQEINIAKHEVEPIIGSTATMAFDSAASVYEAALKSLGHDTRSLRPFPSAMQASFRAAVRCGNQPHLAMDGKTQRSFAEQFPGAMKLKVR